MFCVAFLPRDAMLARYMLSSCLCFCLSVCMSVTPDIASKRLNRHVGSRKQRITIAREIRVSAVKDLREIQTDSYSTGTLNAGGIQVYLLTLPHTKSTISRCTLSVITWRQQALQAIFKAHCYTDQQLPFVSTYVYGNAQTSLGRFVIDILYEQVCRKYSNKSNRWSLSLSVHRVSEKNTHSYYWL